MSAETPKRLGRGLEALISTARQQRDINAAPSDDSTLKDVNLRDIAIASVSPNHFQPRRTFKESDLDELTSSLKTNGLLQPIVVRKAKGDHYELVAGERRLRAATKLGWKEIPAVIRNFDDREMLTLALVENLQRSDLNAFEEAEGYQRLIDDFGLTQQQVAEAVGKDRTTVTGLLRLLHLPAPIRTMVEKGQLAAGHARALLAMKNEKAMIALANETVARQLSVRDIEARARLTTSSVTSGGSTRKASDTPAAPSTNPQTRLLENKLRAKLQTDVSIRETGKDRGSIQIAFFNPDDLERLLDLILGRHRSDFD